MKKLKVKGFTLVELLIVISIIALLLAVLIPSLNKAKETGNRIVCGNHLKTIGMANIAYANENNQLYCPLVYGFPRFGMWTKWLENMGFRKTLNLNAYGKDRKGEDTSGAANSKYSMPRAFLCPSDKISMDWANAKDNVLCSYGYNSTDWVQISWGTMWNSPAQNYFGHKADKITLPSTKLAFTDSIDWWVAWKAADYAAVEHTGFSGWDKLHQANIKTYKANGYHGPVIYRHSEGANVGFYDGHTEYMKKQQIYVLDDRNLADPMNRRPGMWVVDMTVYKRNESR